MNVEEKYVCIFCEEKDLTEEGLAMHLLYNHGGGVRCELCDHCSLTHKDHQEHMIYSHFEVANFSNNNVIKRKYNENEQKHHKKQKLEDITSFEEKKLQNPEVYESKSIQKHIFHNAAHLKRTNGGAESNDSDSKLGSSNQTCVNYIKAAANKCPMCGLEVNNLELLQAHVDSHFTEDERKNDNQSTASQYPSTSTDIKSALKDNLTSHTLDVSKMLEEYLNFLGIRCWFAENCAHFSTKKMPDHGYGCGYRNTQMILSSLSFIREYKTSLFQGRLVIPSVLKLQGLLEQAWQAGWDMEGRNQLGGHVVGTVKWIGASDVVALLSFLRVKCVLYDFNLANTKSSVKHPKLIPCIKNYFKTHSSHKIPIFLQYEGHSKTIVGVVEKENGEDALVILDPSMSMAKMRFLLDKLKKNIKNNPQNIVNKEKKNESYEKKVNKNLSGPEKSSNMKNQTKPKDSEKKSLKNDMMKEIKEFIYEGKELQRAQYQLIMVVGRFTDDEEWMNSKVLSSVRIS